MEGCIFSGEEQNGIINIEKNIKTTAASSWLWADVSYQASPGSPPDLLCTGSATTYS